ncbi:MAG: beta-ketoacyl synthase N-terminal-like domain-containing protein, partial [Pseudomonadota bacterium]
MSQFEDIAIIGQGCILPGCHSPSALWQTAINGHINIRSPGNGAWRSDNNAHLKGTVIGKISTDKGGYIDQSYTPDDSAFDLDRELLAELDPLFHWTLEAANQALVDANCLATQRS